MTIILIAAAAVFLFWAAGKGYLKMDGSGVSQIARTMGGYAEARPIHLAAAIESRRGWLSGASADLRAATRS